MSLIDTQHWQQAWEKTPSLLHYINTKPVFDSLLKRYLPPRVDHSDQVFLEIGCYPGR